MFPKMILTLDEELNMVKTKVRVGKAVDVVGQAGKPKSITGFQTRDTPVILNTGERGELTNEGDFESLTNTLEGIVILRKKQGL